MNNFLSLLRLKNQEAVSSKKGTKKGTPFTKRALQTRNYGFKP